MRLKKMNNILHQHHHPYQASNPQRRPPPIHYQCIRRSELHPPGKKIRGKENKRVDPSHENHRPPTDKPVIAETQHLPQIKEAEQTQSEEIRSESNAVYRQYLQSDVEAIWPTLIHAGYVDLNDIIAHCHSDGLDFDGYDMLALTNGWHIDNDADPTSWGVFS